MKTEAEKVMFTFLTALATAITLMDPMNPPSVLGKSHGFEQDTLCWDGPFEWCCCLVGGCSIYAGEFGGYGSTKLEEPLANILDQIEACGYFLEPVDSSSQIHIYEA